MMRMEGGGAAMAHARPSSATEGSSSTPQDTQLKQTKPEQRPQQGAAGAAARNNSAVALPSSGSADFMGNQLATYFSQLFEKNQQESVIQRKEKKKGNWGKKNKGLHGNFGAMPYARGDSGQVKVKLKERQRKVDLTTLNCLATPALPQVAIPRNPSPFGVFAAVRLTCLSNKQERATLLQLESAAAWKEAEDANSTDPNDTSSGDEMFPKKNLNLPKIVGIGLMGVFEIIRESRQAFPSVCRRALGSLLNILQGLQPEELSREPEDVMEPAFEILLELASSAREAFGDDDSNTIKSLASACLISFAVAYGNSGKMLLAISTMLMCSLRGSESFLMPSILVSLQRSVISVMLGKTEHPDFMTHGVTKDSYCDSFPILLKGDADKYLTIYSQASDGLYLYFQTSQGLFKVGSGYASTIKGCVYRHNPNFSKEPGWLGCIGNHIYFRQIGQEEKGAAAAAAWCDLLSLVKVDPETLTSLGTITTKDHFMAGSGPHVLLTDGVHLGVVTMNNKDNFIIKFFDPSAKTPLSYVSELPLKLARKCVDVYGSSLFDPDGGGKRYQVETNNSNDDIIQMQIGKDFALMLLTQGRVSYTGKSSSIGQKQLCQPGQWNEMNLPKSPKIIQMSVGHEGQHALFLSDEGVVYFVGTSKRGEDGDQSKARRQPKPSKPKKIHRMEGFTVTRVAANNGTSAFVTKEGDVYVFGKDSSHSDYISGQVTDLKGIPISEIAIGKAHVIALSKDGDVYSFGMNNKGQCGRDYQQSKLGAACASNTSILGDPSKMPLDGLDDQISDHDADIDGEGLLGDQINICAAGKHKWRHNQCMICSVCGECTGYGSVCVSSGRPERNVGTMCGCGSGDSGCSECGCCRNCAGEELSAVGVPGGDAEVSAKTLYRLNVLGAVSGQEGHKLPAHHPMYREKVIRRRLQKMGNSRRSRRFTEKDINDSRRGDDLFGNVREPRNKDGRIDKIGLASEKLGGDNEGLTGSGVVAISDIDKEAGKLASLPPAKIIMPKGVKVKQVSAGLHHSLILTKTGEVYSFGSNSHGQIGTADLIPRESPTLVNLPEKAVQVAAGSYHSAILLANGEVFTFGNMTKNQLGRDLQDEGQAEVSTAEEIAAREMWFARPGPIKNVGAKFGRSATWIGASGDQTFLKIDESLINCQSLMGATVMANSRHILLLPTQDFRAQNSSSTTIANSAFRSLIISRTDGFCRSFCGDEQGEFRSLSVCLDPHYNLLWAYSNKRQRVSCYHPFMNNIIQKMSPDGNQDSLTTNILSPELALPLISNCFVSRNQASLNLLSCLDCLTQLSEVNLVANEEELTKAMTQKSLTKEDFSVVNRFDAHGGGWGYSGHSIEAVRIMCDTEVLLGGFGLFGGRGEYVGKIKLFDLGFEGGDHEGDGDLISEADEVTYECGARQKFPILFEEPVTLQPGRWYVAWARVSGPSSDCGSSGQTLVTTDDQIQFHFKSSKKSNNGTDVNAGQIPQLLYKIVTNEGKQTHRKSEPMEPVCILTGKFSKAVTTECFQALLSLIHWSWSAFKAGICEMIETAGVTDDDAMTQDIQRLIFICRACLRLIVGFTEEVYPCRILPTHSKPVPESQKLAECVYEVRVLLQQILTDTIPGLPSKKQDDNLHMACQKMANLIWEDTHRTFVSCFHAFYPNGYLKWACICNLLASVESTECDSMANFDRLLTAVLDALCNPLIKLRNTFPISYSPETESRCKNLSPTENLSITASMIQACDNSVQRYPILTELMNIRVHRDGMKFSSWTFRDVLDRLLFIASQPVKQSLKAERVTFSEPLVEKSCLVISSVISELANQTVQTTQAIQSLGGSILQMTPNRFTRTSNSRTWNTSNGSPDAICFSVDRPGIFIVGCCVYGGMGTYDYELELLDDQSGSEKDSGANAQRWCSLEVAHGSYSSDDCVSDIAELKFDRSVAIRPHIKYALRLRNHGGRTSNGDGGCSTVKGADGTTFTFSSCSLSFNGTNQTRGQVPQILYFSSPQETDVQSSTKSLAEMYARRTALSMTSAIVKTLSTLLVKARDSVDEKGLEILNSAPIVTRLMPHVLASISSLAVKDPPSAVQVLTFIQDILPSVAALNNIEPLHEVQKVGEPLEPQTSPNQHFAWVESEHPYKPATVTNHRAKFPASVRWMSLEFDSRCCTAQPEDSLQIYIRNPTSDRSSEKSVKNPDAVEESSPLQKYIPVLKKFCGTRPWPQHSIILPGNEVLLSLETASDYVKDDKPKNYGFRCLVVGYESDNCREMGLKNLELELAYLGGTCAASLMKKNIYLPTKTSAIQGFSEGDQDEDMDVVEESAAETYEMHSALLSKGFALERPPSVTEAIDGIIPFSYNSNERLFLKNFVNCVTDTSGGRLARWLQPESYVDVDQCRVHYNVEEMRCHWPSIITVITKDQYGDIVQVPDLKVEVKAVPLTISRFKKQEHDAMTFGGHRPPNLEAKYEVTVDDKWFYHAITVQKPYVNYSFEELRYASPALPRQSENMLVRPNNDGTYSANWTPGNIGWYQIHVMVDGCDLLDTYKVEVREPPQGMAPPMYHTEDKKSAGTDTASSKSRKFITRPSAGLRIRVHPTLQSEQIGIVPVDSTINIVDELSNSDGVWVRVAQDTLMEFVDTTMYSEGWCLQYNKHLEKTLLIPVVPSEQQNQTTKPSSSFGAGVATLVPLSSTQNSGKVIVNGRRHHPAYLGSYTVVQCGASGHNIRSSPSMSAAPIGILNIGDTISVLAVNEDNGELWIQLDQRATEKHCFSSDGDAWSLAISATDIQYIQSDQEKAEWIQGGYEMPLKPVTVANAPFPRQSVKSTPKSDEKPVRRNSLVVPGKLPDSSFQPRSRTPSPSTASADGRKPSFFQKWFKTEGTKSRNASPSPPAFRKPAPVITAYNKDIPPELQGVSVKELVKVIGESRANGNGATPPDSPASARRQTSRSVSPQSATNAASSSRGSSPASSKMGPQIQANPLSVTGVQDYHGRLSSPSRSRNSQSPQFDLWHAVRPGSQDSPQSSDVSTTFGTSFNSSKREGSVSPVPSLKSAENSRFSESPPRTGKKSNLESEPQKTGHSSKVSRDFRNGSRQLLNQTREKVKAKFERTKKVKEAISPSVAESIRSVFAAFIWHEGVVHDAMAIASYLKFRPKLTKHERSYYDDCETRANDKEKRSKQRHSVEVISTSFIQDRQKLLFEMFGAMDASSYNVNINRNMNQSCASTDGHNDAIDPVQQAVSALPPTLRLFVMLWEEIRSYCVHAILQHFIVNNGQIPPSVSKKHDSSSKSMKWKSKRIKRSRTMGQEDKESSNWFKAFVKGKPEQQGNGDNMGVGEVAAMTLQKTKSQADVHQKCEMCGHMYQHPVTFHMRGEHPGCGGPSGGKGYNSGGHYCGGWAGNCGDGGTGESTYYLLCPKCRDEYMSGVADKASLSPAVVSSSFQRSWHVRPSDESMNKANQQHKVRSRSVATTASNALMSSLQGQKLTSPSAHGNHSNSHVIMNNNAMFLLDLSSASSPNGQPIHSTGNKSNQSSSGIMQTSTLSAFEELLPFDPNPFPLVPFQCFQALGVEDGHLRLINDELILDDALKLSGETSVTRNSKENSEVLDIVEEQEISPPEQFQTSLENCGHVGCKKPFGRSVSVGDNVVLDNSSKVGEIVESPDFLAKPSPALKKLFTVKQASQPVLIDILQRPVMSFVLQWNDLDSLQIAMTTALRKAACRTYAMQALNWLLRSVSQPSCLHDLLWCFAAALDNTVEEFSTDEKTGSKDKKSNEEKKGDRTGLFEHPSTDLRIAGDSIQPLPSTFHGLLQTVSDLMLLLPVGSSLQQIAITCWGIKFKPTDHHFLHQSHVFSTISKILSRSEELDSVTPQAANAQTNLCGSEARVEKLTDITQNLDLKVSSRLAMLVSLIDNSTETFWESGEEDRNKSKWVTASIPSNTHGAINTISLHIDNGRDLGNKVGSIIFKGGKTSECLQTFKQIDIESRFAGWVSCFMPNLKFIRIELKGPDSTLRLRQIKALGVVAPSRESPQPSTSNSGRNMLPASMLHGDISVAVSASNQSRFFEPCSIQQLNCEAETLRVFRLITSQVFGRLLEDTQGTFEEEVVPKNPRDWDDEESNLKEHVVGILFSGSRLTHLQKEVCAHIVESIRKEASRLRDDWEVSLCSGEPSTAEEVPSTPDTYCFEMLSLVLALSGSSVGRKHVASQCGLIADLLTLLHTGTARIQRQVISLIKRVMAEIAPAKFAALLSVYSLPPKDFGILASARSSEGEVFDMKKLGILDVFLSCIAKALKLQVKVKGLPREATSRTVTTVSLASSVHPRDPTGPRWWLRGSSSRKMAEEVISFMKDMTAGKLGEEWSSVTKGAVAENILNLTKLGDQHKESNECLRQAPIWLALASLCVMDRTHVEGLSSGEWNGKQSDNPRPTCDNHDDGETLAIIMCDSCGNLCGDCDRFLHLHRKTRAHQRQIFKEEEEAIKVDLHEGCGRAKLFWVMALADSSTLKAMVEFRDGGRTKSHASPAEINSFVTCRFCGVQGNDKTPVLNGVCTDKECVGHAKSACTNIHPCGHFCGGIANETTCLPCLHGCAKAADLKQDADDMCMICFTDALSPIPSIQLDCGHVFHRHCCAAVLEKRWIGPRITFGFRNCPICKSKIQHPSLQSLIDPIDSLFEDVKKKSLMRLEYEGLTKCEAIEIKGSRFYNDPLGFSLDRYAYYVCFKCGSAYYGGEAQCDADAGLGDDYNPEELVCGGCSDVSRAQMCPKHGTDFLEYKCRYCCSVAVFFCFGNTHFCNACHDDSQRVANVPKQALPQCPVGPKLRRLEGEECPLHVNHPPTGEEFALGCGICRNAHTF